MRLQSTSTPAPSTTPAHRRLTAFITFFVLAAAMALSAAPAQAQEDPPDRVGRLADSQGKVWRYDDERNDWEEISRNQPIALGDRLSTDNDARAEVRIGSTVLRLGPATDVEMRALDDRRVSVALGAGTLAARVRTEEAAREFEVLVADGRFAPAAAGHYRVDLQDGRLAGTAWIGDLRFEGGNSSFLIPNGRRAEISEQGQRHDWAELERDPFSDWVAHADRDDADTRVSSRYVSPDMTGAEDLDRYGDWDSHTEYGAIWYPRNVVVGWAPYRYGRWSWVAPWGWTWVDDARWGFAPSHYGRWVYYGNRWGWCPGSYVARPVYSPALVGWVGGGHVSLSFSIGGPAVGWVPLAPREVYRPVYTVSPGYWRRLNGPGVVHPGPYRPPTGPIMYANRGKPGAVTVVSADVLKQRQPVAAAFQRIDARDRDNLVARATSQAAPQAPAGRPEPGVRRVVAVQRADQPIVPPRPIVRATEHTNPVVGRGADDGRKRIQPADVARDGQDGNGREPGPRAGRTADDVRVQTAPRDGAPRSQAARPDDDGRARLQGGGDAPSAQAPRREEMRPSRAQRPNEGGSPSSREFRSDNAGPAPRAIPQGRDAESPRSTSSRDARPTGDDERRITVPHRPVQAAQPEREVAPRSPVQQRDRVVEAAPRGDPQAPRTAPPAAREAAPVVRAAAPQEVPRQRVEAPARADRQPDRQPERQADRGGPPNRAQ